MKETEQRESIQVWVKRHKRKLQSIALALIVSGSFGVFAALQSGLEWIAGMAFAIIALSFAMMMWAG